MLRRIQDFGRQHWAELAIIAIAVIFGLGVLAGMRFVGAGGGEVHSQEHQLTAAKDEQLHQDHTAAAAEASQSHQTEHTVLYYPNGQKKLERTREGEQLEHRTAVAAGSTDVRTKERVEYRDREVVRIQSPRFSLDLLVGLKPLALDWLAPVRALEVGLVARFHLFGPFWIGGWVQTSPTEPLKELKVGVSFGGTS
jgi:hypothetical protein